LRKLIIDGGPGVPELVAITIKKEGAINTSTCPSIILTTVIPAALLPGRCPGTLKTGGLVGPTGFWTGLLNIIFLDPIGNSKPEPSTP
jgi:hypothetical protein